MLPLSSFVFQRYIAETRCLAGEAASERVAIDTLATAATELYFRICAISFQPSEEAKATFINDLLRPKFFTKALPAFEKVQLTMCHAGRCPFRSITKAL